MTLETAEVIYQEVVPVLKEITLPKEESMREYFEILSELDVETLRKTGEIIARQILEDYPNELPDVIIYPDTAARPLKYLFEPIFTKIAKERNVKKPEYVFFMPTDDTEIKKVRDILQDVGLDTPSEKILDILEKEHRENNHIIKKLGYWVEEELRKEKLKYAKRKEAVARYPEIQVRYKERAAEIIDRYGVKYENETPSIIVIDETALPEARTIRSIQNIFHDVGISDLKLYSLTSWGDMKYPGVFVGEDESLMYRDTRGAGIREAFGVEKGKLEDSLYVHTRAERDRISEKALRNDMEKLGNQIAEKF